MSIKRKAQLSIDQTELARIKASLQTLNNSDISHEDLGQYGFQDTENVKNEFCEYVTNILDRYVAVNNSVSSTTATNALLSISKKCNAIVTVCDQINQLVEKPQAVHQPNYPSQKDAFSTKIKTNFDAIQHDLNQITIEIRLGEIENLHSDKSAKDLSKELKDKLIILDNHISQAKLKSSALSSASAEKVAEKSEGVFTILAQGHENREKYWFKSFLAFSALFAIAVSYIVLTSIPTDDVPLALAEIFKRLLIISTAGIGMKVSLKKYNLERNLKIIYDHRSTALNNYAVLEAAIDDDPERKNQLRLEIAKYVFTEPETGYKGPGSSNSELSINPVLNTIENAKQKIPNS